MTHINQPLIPAFFTRTVAVLLAILLPPTGLAGEVLYVHTDHLGSPAVYTNAQDEVVAQEFSTPYGRTLNAATPNDTTNDTVSFTGHYRDGNTDLIYMQARYYDPVIGRFLSVDPVTFSPGKPEHFNRYWYAYGNPYLYTDPDGNEGVGVTLDANVRQLINGDITKTEYKAMLDARGKGALIGVGVVAGGGALTIAGTRLVTGGILGSEAAMTELGAASSVITVASEVGEALDSYVKTGSLDLSTSDAVDVASSLIPGGGEAAVAGTAILSTAVSVLEAAQKTPDQEKTQNEIESCHPEN